jgi:DENN domain-containing protein 4
MHQRFIEYFLRIKIIFDKNRFWLQNAYNTDPLSDVKTISITCLWDNPRLHAETGPPMYQTWRQNQPSSPLLKALLTEQTTLNRA